MAHSIGLADQPVGLTRRGPARVALVDRPAYPWVVLVASLVVQTAASFGTQGISPLAPFLVDDLGLTRAQVGLLVTAAYGGAVLVLILAGGLCDRFGVRALFALGLSIAGAPLVLASSMPTYLWLLVPMVLCGIGNGCALPPTTRAIVEWFPIGRRGLAMGIKQTGVPLAGVICGLVVPAVGETLGWRGALLALGLLAVASGGLVWLAYRDRHDEPSATPKRPREAFTRVIKDRNLLLLPGFTWLYAGVQLSFVAFLVLFLCEQVGLSLGAAAMLLVLAQASGVAGQVVWGAVSDALFGGRRKVVIAIIGALAAACSPQGPARCAPACRPLPPPPASAAGATRSACSALPPPWCRSRRRTVASAPKAVRALSAARSWLAVAAS